MKGCSLGTFNHSLQVNSLRLQLTNLRSQPPHLLSQTFLLPIANLLSCHRKLTRSQLTSLRSQLQLLEEETVPSAVHCRSRKPTRNDQYLTFLLNQLNAVLSSAYMIDRKISSPNHRLSLRKRSINPLSLSPTDTPFRL